MVSGRRKGSRKKAAVPAGDVETILLSSCVDLFVTAQTDRAADARVISYLNERFGPPAYEDAEEDPDPKNTLSTE
jgi:hypothetical protein